MVHVAFESKLDWKKLAKHKWGEKKKLKSSFFPLIMKLNKVLELGIKMAI